MSDQRNEVLSQLEPLRLAPARSSDAARSGLQAFLTEAAQLRPLVSAPDQMRSGWKSAFRPMSPPMLILAKIMLIVALLLGGAGVTTVAAQSSLPGDGLYPIKLFVEDARAAFTVNPQAQIDLHLELAQVRTHELQQLIEQHRAIPDDAPLRLRIQLQAALQAAAQLDDAPLQSALNQIEARVMAQGQSVAHAQANAPDDRGLRTAAQTLTQMQALAHLGVSDPAAFRARFGAGRPRWTPPLPTPDSSPTPSPTTQTPIMTYTVTPAHTPQPSHTPRATRTPNNTGTPQGNSNGRQSTTQPGNGGPPATPLGNGPGPDQPPTSGGGGGNDSGGNGGGGSGGRR
jgi:hypothetical protein